MKPLSRRNWRELCFMSDMDGGRCYYSRGNILKCAKFRCCFGTTCTGILGYMTIRTLLSNWYYMLLSQMTSCKWR